MKSTNNLLSRVIAAIFMLSLLMPGIAVAQKDDAKKQEKEAKDNAKDDKRIDKTIRKYEEALGKAREKYEKEDDFRDTVDMTYRQMQRDHAKQAFDINTFDQNDWVATNTGEKLPKNTDTLYDNMMAQDYVNRVGQSLVPANSTNRYGFKITVDPMPDARTLSTGTVYVSTGLLSLVDNEAQLAYVLGHEIGHVEKEHWKQDILVAQYIEEATKSAEKKAAIAGAVAGGVLGATPLGGLFGGNKAQNVAVGTIIGVAASKYLVKMFDKKAFEWSAAQEDECDKLALQYMLDRNYDVREATAFYETLQAAAIEDPRIELDKFADRKRSEERRKTVDTIIKLADTNTLAKTLVGATNLRGKSLSIDRNLPVVINRIQRNQAKMADQISQRLASGEILAGDGEFENIMSALKRDNGISAFYYDMYKLSERNLSQALAIRSDDPLGYFYYGKVIKLTARKPGEREKALQMFARAIELDKRNALPHSRLYLALTKMGGRTTNNIDEIVNDLKDYVAQYQRLNGGALPPSMNVIYDYMQEAGEVNWNATVYTNVRDIDANGKPQAAPATTTRRQ